MSADLLDLKRLKITAETRAWLTAEVSRTGQSAQEVARDVLHQFALEKIEGARLLLALSPGQGHNGDSRGRAK